MSETKWVSSLSRHSTASIYSAFDVLIRRVLLLLSLVVIAGVLVVPPVLAFSLRVYDQRLTPFLVGFGLVWIFLILLLIKLYENSRNEPKQLQSKAVECPDLLEDSNGPIYVSGQYPGMPMPNTYAHLRRFGRFTMNDD